MKTHTKNEIVLFKRKKSKLIQDGEISRTEPMIMQKKNNTQATFPASEVSSVLLRIKGSWPWDFMQDELIIEEKRIIIKKRYFPFVTNITTIPMNRLSNFEVTHSLFYSSVYIKANMIAEISFQWLKHDDAQKAKELIDGIRIRDNESIVVLENEKRRYIQTLELMGQT